MDRTDVEAVEVADGMIELRLTGKRLVQMDGTQTLAVCIRALSILGWSVMTQEGVALDGGTPVAMPPEKLRTWLERLRAGGSDQKVDVKRRVTLYGPWEVKPDTEGAAPPRVRRFSKDPAPAPVAAPAKKVVKVVTVTAAAEDLPTIFSDPGDQLDYEVRHAYLLQVPPSQREQWPLQDFGFLPSFLEDVNGPHDGQVSRVQILSAIVDVVSTRVVEVNSRRVRPLRDGGGDHGRPVVIRASDGATAWRANISHGTPAARRIMWWKTPDGFIELARLATHDDVEVPER